MKQIFSVFAFTFKVGARKKTFIITTVIMLVLVFAVCLLPSLLVAVTGGDTDSIGSDNKFYRCYYIDETGMLSGGEQVLAEAFPDVAFYVRSPQDREALVSGMSDDAKSALVLVTAGEDGRPEISVIAKDFLNKIAASYGDVSTALGKLYAQRVMENAGVGQDVISDAQADIRCELITEGGLNLSGYIAGMLLTTLTFFAVYYYGYGIAASIASEKSSRIMETLVVSAKPTYILIGKCLGMGVLGLSQFGGILIFAAVCWSVFVPADFTLFGISLSFASFTPGSVALIILFFILGYTLYALMNAVCGATIDKLEDLNAAMMPVMLISMGAFYLSYFTAVMGTTYDYLVNTCMYVPFCAPFIMPFIILNGEVEAWQVALSAAILAVSIVAVAAVSVRIYNASVMHYGKRLKLFEAIRKNKKDR